MTTPALWIALQPNEHRAYADECGCRLERHGPGDDPAYYQCRLHDAAPALADMLRRALNVIDVAEKTYGWSWDAKDDADALLLAANGQTQEP